MTKRLFIIICILFTITIVVCFYALSGNRASKSISSWTNAISKEDDSSQWFKIRRTKKTRGVALVVHGLNLKPERMQSIIAELNDAGIDVLNLSLRGHGNNYLKNMNISIDGARLESFRTVTYSSWLDEIYEAYLKVRERASKKNVPAFFIGYSLGGLMGCDLILSHPDVYYDRMVLFAPALNITVESYLLKALMPFPNIVIDSLSPASYRANEGTPMAAYKALFEAIEHFEKNVNDKLNKPTLVFIDERDEFVSCSKLREMITWRNLDEWQVRIVQKDNDPGEKISHHLIIDIDSVGKQMWKQIKDAIRRHLSVGASISRPHY
ncbi:MAG: alpha/beta fold hydrolase [Syntrophales bacterium]|jgi:esterase/lipase